MANFETVKEQFIIDVNTVVEMECKELKLSADQSTLKASKQRVSWKC